MAPLQPGDALPSGIKFDWVPIETDDPKVVGSPTTYDADEKWKGKRVVIISVPGAFTPGCQQRHLPPFIENYSTFKSKGVDVVAVLAYNDAFVMNAWGKINGGNGKDIHFLSDTKSKFSENHGWNLGERNGRWAMIVDNGKITYSSNEDKPGDVTVSGADAVIAKL